MDNTFLEKESAEAFARMRDALRKDGIEVVALSGFRSFERQREIWNRKIEKFLKEVGEDEAVRLVLRHSAFPGTSRHGWGTDVDIAGIKKVESPLEHEHYRDGGVYHDLYLWLKENGERFGFHQVYIVPSEKRDVEEWHWSYAPSSRKYLKIFLKEIRPDFLRGRGILLEERVLDDFETYIKDYILSINPLLLPDEGGDGLYSK